MLTGYSGNLHLIPLKISDCSFQEYLIHYYADRVNSFVESHLGRKQMDERAAQLLGMKGKVADDVIDQMLLLFVYTRTNFRLIWRDASKETQENMHNSKRLEELYEANLLAFNAEIFVHNLVQAGMYAVERAHYGHSSNDTNILSQIIEGLYQAIEPVMRVVPHIYLSKVEVCQHFCFVFPFKN